MTTRFEQIALTPFDALCIPDLGELHEMARDGDLRHVDDHGPGAFSFRITDDEGMEVRACHNDIKALAHMALGVLRHAGDGVTVYSEEVMEEAMATELLADESSVNWGPYLDSDCSLCFAHPKGATISDDVIEYLHSLVRDSQALVDYRENLDVFDKDAHESDERAMLMIGVGSK